MSQFLLSHSLELVPVDRDWAAEKSAGRQQAYDWRTLHHIAPLTKCGYMTRDHKSASTSIRCLEGVKRYGEQTAYLLGTDLAPGVSGAAKMGSGRLTNRGRARRPQPR